MRRALALAGAAALLAAAPAAAADGPKTPFEQSGEATWTTDVQEAAFLKAVDAGSPRLAVSEIGRTAKGRPLNLVRVGAPAPRSAAAARKQPTLLFVCSQHGNEPAGREACLKLLRDLGYGADDALLKRANVLFVPAANPDGRAANTRENSAGVDINRDHLNLVSPEARAVAAVVRDYQPDMVVDLHEYGPSIPVLYDDEVLYLWPRNLNTDQKVHDLAVDLAQKYMKADSEKAGYSVDEYGQYEVAGNDIHQEAGDADEGIARNLMGLRHSLGILVETRVDADPRNGPDELMSDAAVNRRRVAAHMATVHGALRFLAERGDEAATTTAGAMARKAKEGAARSAPVYFGGADNEEPAAEDVVSPPPCGYRLTAAQLKTMGTTLGLLGIAEKDGVVSMAQPAEPLIPLLLDERGTRHSVAATPLGTC